MTVGADPAYVDPTAGFDAARPFGASPVTAAGDVPPVPSPPPFDLFTMAQSLLALVVDGFEARGVTLPSFRYVGGGASVAYDGEQVTVNATRVAPGKPDVGAAGMPAMFMEQAGSFAVAIVRSFPADMTPDTAAIERAAKVNADDLATLWAVLVDLRDRSAWPRLDQPGAPLPWSITDVHGEGPQGGVVAAVGVVSVSLV